MKIPMLRIISTSVPVLTSPVAGPRTTPMVAYAMIEFKPKRLNTPSSSFATTMSSPIERGLHAFPIRSFLSIGPSARQTPA